MREKYESLALVQLKELAKARGLKGTSTMKKAELVEAMLAEDERVKEQEAEKAAKSEETQQTRESASKPVHRRNVVTNTRSSQARAERTDRPERTERIERAERQERSERPEKTDRPVGVMNESTYRAEPTAQSESADRKSVV